MCLCMINIVTFGLKEVTKVGGNSLDTLGDLSRTIGKSAFIAHHAALNTAHGVTIGATVTGTS